MHLNENVCIYVCVCISVFFPSVDLHSSCFPSAADLVQASQPRITRQICKNTILISRQKWQSPPLTSAPRIQFFFLFHFHFSFPVVHLRHKYSLTVLPTLSLRGHAYSNTHLQYICTVTHADMDSISHCAILCSKYVLQGRNSHA